MRVIVVIALMALSIPAVLAQQPHMPPPVAYPVHINSERNPVTEEIIRSRLTRCPVTSPNPSYFELKAAGYRLMKESRHAEAKQCFMDAMHLYLSRVGLYAQTPGEEPNPDQAAAFIPQARQVVLSSPYTQMPAGTPRDPRLGLSYAESAGVLEEDGSSVRDALRKKSKMLKGAPLSQQQSVGPSLLSTTTPPAANTHSEGNAPVGAWKGGSKDSALPWRHSPPEAWLTDPKLLERTREMYNTQLEIQLKDLGSP